MLPGMFVGGCQSPAIEGICREKQDRPCQHRDSFDELLLIHIQTQMSQNQFDEKDDRESAACAPEHHTIMPVHALLKEDAHGVRDRECMEPSARFAGMLLQLG